MEDAIDMVLEKGWLSGITSHNSIPHSLSGESTSVRCVRQKVCGVQAVAWVGKGLAMRGHNLIAGVASFLLKLLLSGTYEVFHCSSCPCGIAINFHFRNIGSSVANVLIYYCSNGFTCFSLL